MDREKDACKDRPSRGRVYEDRNIYRKNISVRGKYCCRFKYKYTDLYITSDREISEKVRKPVAEFYDELEEVISRDKGFGSSLCPISARDDYPPMVKEMCRTAWIFNVGPMAAVAGAVSDKVAENISGECSFLMIENGGDVYIKSDISVNAGLFSGSKYFPDSLSISISPDNMPCGLCSSSGLIGPSFSMGTSDLVTVMSDTAVMADAAATAIANSIKEKSDVDRVLKHYKDHKEIKGLVIIKDDRLAICGALELCK